jgi:hypothetical protein
MLPLPAMAMSASVSVSTIDAGDVMGEGDELPLVVVAVELPLPLRVLLLATTSNNAANCSSFVTAGVTVSSHFASSEAADTTFAICRRRFDSFSLRETICTGGVTLGVCTGCVTFFLLVFFSVNWPSALPSAGGLRVLSNVLPSLADGLLSALSALLSVLLPTAATEDTFSTLALAPLLLFWVEAVTGSSAIGANAAVVEATTSLCRLLRDALLVASASSNFSSSRSACLAAISCSASELPRTMLGMSLQTVLDSRFRDTLLTLAAAPGLASGAPAEA